MSNIYVLCEHTRGKTVHPLYQSRITRHFIELVFSPLLFHSYFTDITGQTVYS